MSSKIEEEKSNIEIADREINNEIKYYFLYQ